MKVTIYDILRHLLNDCPRVLDAERTQALDLLHRLELESGLGPNDTGAEAAK